MSLTDKKESFRSDNHTRYKPFFAEVKDTPAFPTGSIYCEVALAFKSAVCICVAVVHIYSLSSWRGPTLKGYFRVEGIML